MRAVAQHLGTGSATLYWHVHNKEDLLKLILDDTFRGVEPPADGAWDARLAVTATRARSVLLPRPSLVPVLWESGWDLGPHVLRVADALLALIAQSGLPDQDVTDAYFALITYVLGFVVAETAAGGTKPFGTEEAAAPDNNGTWEQLQSQYPALTRYAPSTDTSAMHRRFTLGLNSLIRGIKSAGTTW